ncbi:MAG: GNAT family N-acetyltransferase [Planctomycetota bacterium]
MHENYPWGDALPTLSTERLRLRHVTAADVDALYAVFGDPEVMHYWSHAAWTDRAEALAYQQSIQRGFDSRSLFQWGIAPADDNRLLGTCTLYQLIQEQRRGELGIILGREAWGQGLGTEALQALIQFAFQELGLHRLEADVDPVNARSLALFEGLGFQREGVLKERWFVHGAYQDSILLGLLNRD